MRYEKSCGAVVYELRGNVPFFLVEYMALGHVSIPKGHVEENETEEETALREIREETNLEVRLDSVFRHEVTYSHHEGMQKTVVFFIAEARDTSGIRPQEKEVSAIRMMDPEAAVRAVTYDTDREVLRHAAAYLARKFGLAAGTESGASPDQYLLPREHAVDIHSHIVFGVDDGAQSLQEAAELTDLDREEGIGAVFATPHYGEENVGAPDRELVLDRFSQLREEKNRRQVPAPYTDLYLGTEWYCSDEIIRRILDKKAFPMGGSDWYMVEFLEWGPLTEPAETILGRLTKMRRAGIKTILAHPERYQALQQDRDLVKRICDLGVLLQVNAYDLFLNGNEMTRSLAQWMAQERLISFLGSDMHGVVKKKPRLKEGIRWLYENTDPGYADAVVRGNAEKLLGVKKLSVH